MRIACLQFSPCLGQVSQNIDRADGLIFKTIVRGDVDLLMLPELAFSGYNHPSLAAISPYLEPTTSGPTTTWAIRTALRLSCHVSVGYPEITSDSPGARYNSVVLVSPDGRVLVNYRKSFLYYTDETWAEEGKEGFFAGTVDGLGDVAMGICMDINPYRFTTSWREYEFAYHALANSPSLILLTMAWLDAGSGSDPYCPAGVPDVQSLSYWLERFKPLIEAKGENEVLIALCNRCGDEGNAYYAGTSCVLGVRRGEVISYGLLGKGQEKLLVVDTAQADKGVRIMRFPGMLFGMDGS